MKIELVGNLYLNRLADLFVHGPIFESQPHLGNKFIDQVLMPFCHVITMLAVNTTSVKTVR